MPFACGVGLCSSNCSTHKGPFPTTHKTKTKKKGKKNQQEKIEINKIFKNDKKTQKIKIRKA
jgi:hypothetical protein